MTTISLEVVGEPLRTLGETKRISGNPSVDSVVGPFHGKGAVLARKNETVMQELIDALDKGSVPSIVGGVGDA